MLACIVAHRYGFVPKPGKGNITQREAEAGLLRAGACGFGLLRIELLIAQARIYLA